MLFVSTSQSIIFETMLSERFGVEFHSIEPSIKMNILSALPSLSLYDASQCKSIFYRVSLKLPSMSYRVNLPPKIQSFPRLCEQQTLPSTLCKLEMEMYSPFLATMEHRTGHIALLIQQALIIMPHEKKYP